MFEINFLKSHKKTYPITVYGCDEVGRGPLAGPVVAACVKIQIQSEVQFKAILRILKKYNITDSKKLKASERQCILEKMGIDWINLKPNLAYEVSQSDLQFSFSLVEIDNYEIDRINILQASLKAMSLAFKQTGAAESGLVLIDGNKLFKTEAKADLHAIVKGDSKSLIIALASIIAKEYRDNLMGYYHTLYPQFGFITNMGYPSKAHLKNLMEHGPTPIHRLTFRGVNNETVKADRAKA